MTCDYCCGALCDLCGGCHGCGRKGTTPRTQKGKGLAVLKELVNYAPNAHVLDVQAFAQEEKHLGCVKDSMFPVFARPCPHRPRHGYIDSRPVKDREGLKDLLAEVLADDPQGELMITRIVPAKYNAIWTPSSMVIGPGNDGATAGKGAVTIPLLAAEKIPSPYLTKAGVGAGEWPYIEAVYEKDLQCTLTQLRAGPQGTLTSNYIPKDREVQAVFQTNGEDLPAWEKRIKEIAATPGAVVYHPGGALTDHYSVHARLYEIPVCITFEPQVGQMLVPETPAKDFDPEAMLAGAIAADEYDITLSNASNATDALIYSLHMSGALTGENSKFIGMGAVLMLRMGSVALRGEARHIKAPYPARAKVYTKYFPSSVSFHRASLNRLINIFRYGQWSGSVGGIKWAQCAVSLLDIFNGLRALATDPTPGAAKEIVRALNVAVNQAHNGGWWLNKFTEQASFNSIQNGSIAACLQTAPVFYDIEQARLKMSAAGFEKARTSWSKWPETTARPLAAHKVEMLYTPGVGAIGFKIHSRLLGGKMKALYAKVDDLTALLTANKEQEIFLVQEVGGFKLELRGKGTPPVLIWAEPPLAPQEGK